MIDLLASGTWLDEARVTRTARIAFALLASCLLFLFLTAHGTLDLWGRPLGTDFSNVWTAGRMALEGRASEAWDWPLHYQVQQQAHGSQSVPFYGWHYPPPFLLVAALLASLPYVPALLAWQALGLGAAVTVAQRIVPERTTLWVALGAPVTFVCLAHGHNGFLTAALFGGGLLLLDRRPFLAGILLGCLLYKPQFGLVIPPLLLIGGHHRAFAGACAAASGLIGLTFLLWGWGVWQAFLDSLPLTRAIVIEAGDTGWGKIQSPFAMVRMWGGGVGVAYGVQALATAASLILALWTARSAGWRLRSAAVIAAAILSTPYVLDYDYVLLGISALFLFADGRARGFLSWEKSLLALIWAAPLFARSVATLMLVPLGQASAVLLLVLALRRAVRLDGLGEGFRSSPFRRSHAGSGR